MRQLTSIALCSALFGIVGPDNADAQGLLDPRRAAKSMIDATIGFAMITGAVGDSLKAGPGLEASYQYQFGSVPIRIGGGVGYSRHGLEEPADGSPVPLSGSSNKWSAFALGTVLLFGNDTDMIPYIQARAGYTKFVTNVDETNINQGGLELGALVGVDLPVAESISIDVSGLFAWINSGDATINDVTIPDSSASGSLFSLRAGAFFYF